MGAFIDNLRLALGTLVANPLRTLLTLLGIVIGVATVISMMALIEGLRMRVTSDMSALGANTFEVSKWPSGFGRVNWREIRKRPPITLDDLEALGRLEHVLESSASTGSWAETVANERVTSDPNVQVVGATSGYPTTGALEIERGRFFGEAEELDGRMVAVVGADVADLLWPGQDPVGLTVRIRGRPFRVIGLLERRGTFMGLMSMDNLVVVPLRTFRSLFGNRRSLSIQLAADDPENLAELKESAQLLMRGRHGLAAGVPDSFELQSNDSMTETFNQMSVMVTLAAFAVCLLSLVVGGIGILNIMLMGVTERTREIGIRKALGARRLRILAQFATEAVVLSLIGGLIGLAAGFGLSWLARWLSGIPTDVPTWSIWVALLMSSGVGLLFGIYPAARAAKLDPVEAMRAD
ncbi:MAG TPA: ABC transporter permease [Myxococcaceae bacterium]|nr:ABC transporter permease [Myxococcaceae bacterium]